MYISFEREDGTNSVYVYQDVPESEWESLVAADSHGSYHYDNIRLDYSYEELTDFHEPLTDV
ncbi:KTSC domain-containing protein [Haloarcula sp. CBA1127]|uniref:KTSC domain-containing protein n=1 Tax=Haloarcula sp. CBA1127 TaxID=1765055 RepID=UPI001E2F79BA|nr:KTSC domain-containing protein [Haloarcula sp. CBA1127]